MLLFERRKIDNSKSVGRGQRELAESVCIHVNSIKVAHHKNTVLQ